MKAIIVKARFVNRKDIEKVGVAIIFKTDFGEISKTFNIPTFNSPGCDLFKLLNNKLGIKPPLGILGKPMMFCLAIETKLIGMECDITVTPSGNEKYPYNIINIEPILTLNSSYITQKALD